jgi:2-octaprenyl-6-methoxyphenol hydroxylase
MKALAADIVVAGTGPAGLAAALLAAEAGFSVALAGPAPDVSDARTTALMLPSLALLDGYGLTGRVRAAASPLRTMRIVDATKRLIRAPVVAFQAAEIGVEAFAWNIPNRVLNGTLGDLVSTMPAITWLKSRAGDWKISTDSISAQCAGRTVTARLAIAADGRKSAARQAAGIAVSERAYPQSAIVAIVTHKRPHGDVSTEFHTETGPLTLVPLPGDRSSVVWVVRPDQAERLMALDESAFARELEDRTQSILGALTLAGERQAWPLSAMTPERFGQNRVALAGEAAHVMAPIGAQGLNLGMRDVADIVKIAARHRADPGAPLALTAYDRARRPDIVQRTAGIDALNRSLLTGLLPVQALRAAGMHALHAIPPLRELAMREGMAPGTGFNALRDRMRRLGRDRREASRSS